MWRSTAVCTALLLGFVGRADAQRTLRTLGDDVTNGLGDILHVWAAPLRADGRDWATFALVAAGAVTVSAVDDEIYDFVVERRSAAAVRALEPFREQSDLPLVDLGSGKRLQPLSGVLYLAGFAIDSRALRDAGIGCAAANQAQSIVHEMVKVVVARPRPSVAGGQQYDIELEGSKDWNLHSFYGGHAANVMACMTFWNERFDLGWAEPVLYAIAIGVGVGRMADGRHWMSDTLLGMAFGHYIGRAVAGRSLARVGGRAMPAPPAPSGFYLSRAGRRATIGWRSTF